MHDPSPDAKNDEVPSSLPPALTPTPPTSQPVEDVLLHTLLANTDRQIAYLDPQFNFVQVNDAYIQASGHARAELIGHNHFALFPNAENLAIFERVRDTGDPAAYQDKPFVFVDQPERGVTYWDWTLVPVKDQDGSVQGLLLQIQDVTARHHSQAVLRESEEKYRLMVETAGEGVWLLDAQQRTSYVNKRLTEMLGYRPEEMIGEFSYDFVAPEAKPLAYQYHEQRLQGYRGPVEQRFVRKDGTILWALSSATKLLDANGNLTGFLGMVTDITERKRAEAALRESEEKFRRIVETANEGIWTVDAERRTTYVNQKAAEMLGYRPEEMLGRFSYEFTDEAGKAITAVNIEKRRQGIRESQEFKFLRKDGSTLWALSNACPIYDETGAFVGSLGMLTDITDRKRAEAALESMARFPAENPHPVLRVGRDGVLFYANDAGLQLLSGWQLQMGKPAPVVLREAATRALNTGKRLPLEQEFGERIFAFSVTPLIEAGYVNLYGRDITDRKRAAQEREELLRKEQMARVEAERNADRLSRLQKATAALSGVLTMDETMAVIIQEGIAALGGQSGTLVLKEETSDQLRVVHSLGYAEQVTSGWQTFPLSSRTPIAESIRTGELVSIESEQALVERYPDMARGRRGDSQAWMSIPLWILGEVVGAMGVSFPSPQAFGLQDKELATAFAQQCAQALERARLYEAEQQARAAAEAAVLVREQFIANAWHELKTPMTSVKGYAELLVQRGEQVQMDERFQRMATVINRQAGRLEQMMMALLDISRIEQGELNLSRKEIDLEKLIDCLIGEIRPTLRQHKLVLRRRTEGLTVAGDELRLTQVLDSLIRNAVKFSPMGGSIIIDLKRENEMARIAISDRGIGIPAEDLPRVFTRFYRASNAEAFHINGLGVGLYISREIVRLHGGDITVDSEEGLGSTFSMTLPIATVVTTEG